MRKYISLLVLFISLSSFSQSRDQILNELSELLESQGNPSELFYVESEGFLDIQGHQVKLFAARMRYEESNGPMLGFYCPTIFSPKCIYDPKTKKELGNFAFRMKDKEGVYKAIDLINKIENARDSQQSLREGRESSTKRKNVDALMGGFSDSNGNADGGEGDDNQPGDRGKETGDPNASGYYGIGGDGSGGNYRLGNRRALTRPIPEYDCNEEGKVVVTISVDQSGKVISAQPNAKGTTNSASCLLSRAKEAALRTKFNADSNAPSKQVGLIIYNFSLSE